MKNTILIIFLLFAFCVNAQYYQSDMLMVDGSTKSGFTKLPSNKLFDGKIEFRTSKKGTIEKIDEDGVSRILITSDKGEQYLFERNTVVHLYRSFGKEIKQEKVNKHWMLLYHANASVQCYSLAQRYKINKKGGIMSITGGNSLWSTVYFLLRKPTEEKAFIVSARGFTNGMVRKAMAIYFKDVPEFVERINNKEFKKANVSDVADVYDTYFN